MGSWGGGGMSREGGSRRCPSISRGLIATAHQAQTALRNQRNEHVSMRGLGIVIGMGV